MIRLALIALMALAAPVVADELADLKAEIATCVGPLGALEYHADQCMGDYATRCMDVPENQSTQGMVACISTENAAWDAMLNTEYQALRADLDQEQKDALRDAQRAWIAWRDADCAFPHVFVRGTMSQPWAADCIMQHTARRALELRGFREYLEIDK